MYGMDTHRILILLIVLIKATVGGGTPNFHYRIKAKKGYTSDQGYGRGCPQFSIPDQSKKRVYP